MMKGLQCRRSLLTFTFASDVSQHDADMAQSAFFICVLVSIKPKGMSQNTLILLFTD